MGFETIHEDQIGLQLVGANIDRPTARIAALIRRRCTVAATCIDRRAAHRDGHCQGCATVCCWIGETGAGKLRSRRNRDFLLARDGTCLWPLQIGRAPTTWIAPPPSSCAAAIAWLSAKCTLKT